MLSLHVFYLFKFVVSTYFLFNSLFTAGTLTGFDASGHVAEETKNARVIASKGILSSCIATGVLGFITTILFLFCTPDFNTLFSLNAPQPFVQLYALALGKAGSAFMTTIAVIGLILVRITKDLPKDLIN
jgi:translation initiation factor 5B